MGARVTVEITERYTPKPGMEWITIKSYKTPGFASATWRQRAISDDVSYSVPPTGVTTTRDTLGNVVVTERWDQPRVPIDVVRRVVVETETALKTLESRVAFPLGAVPPEAARFLAGTPKVQKDDARVRDLARRLTAGARTEEQAVSAIVNHVVDRLKYHAEPPGHDAVLALERGIANCQGFSHLSLALLRAAGIPARFAVGVSVAKPWRVQHADGTVTFKTGQGRHAWIEVFYPDVGWLPYDPQTSQLFVSVYHVRQAIGLDVDDAATLITGAPVLPGIDMTVNGDSDAESFTLRTVSQVKAPRSFMAAANIGQATVVAAPPPPPAVVTPPVPPPVVVTPPPPPLRAHLTKQVEFGNMEFPASLRIFRGVAPTAGTTGAVEARPSFVVETADYATGNEELAQAFRVDEPLVLNDIALALQKFGGRSGEVWIDLFDDRGRKPAARVAESQRLPVARLIDRAGYRWVLFAFAPADGGVLLAPGRYWAVLRSRGDGIFNWYFALGNAYGDPDDSRSRPRGAGDWSNILNYRFNFRITGLVKP
jgi:transglutaminase-like putative cysteine protease